jgi:hypothetical protein
MQRFIHWFQQLKPLKILVVFGIGLLFLTTTACSSGYSQGARPQNPPVQAGGQNNPHKMGGDSYTKSTPSKQANVKTVDPHR